MMRRAWGRMARPAARARMVIGFDGMLRAMTLDEMKHGNDESQQRKRDFQADTDLLGAGRLHLIRPLIRDIAASMTTANRPTTRWTGKFPTRIVSKVQRIDLCPTAA